MANRRKRKQRAEDKVREQKMLDDLALALAKDGVTQTAAKPVQSPLAFSVQSHLDGSDKDIHWPNQLGWLQHRAGYKTNQRVIFSKVVDVSTAPQSEHNPIDQIDQMLEDLKDAESAEALSADDEQ